MAIKAINQGSISNLIYFLIKLSNLLRSSMVASWETKRIVTLALVRNSITRAINPLTLKPSPHKKTNLCSSR